MSKKTYQDFINEIILPIENNNVDNGILYIYIPGRLSYNCKLICDNIEWPLPHDHEPGEWRVCFEKDQLFGNKLHLETLSSIIFSYRSIGRLFLADYKGSAEKLNVYNLIWHGHNRKASWAEEHLYNSINLGVNVEYARLNREVNIWNLDTIWSFAFDCVERCYTQVTNKVEEPDVLYREGIEMAKFIWQSYSLNGYIITPSNDLENRLHEKIKTDYMSSYLLKSILFLMNPDSLLEAVAETRTQFAWLGITIMGKPLSEIYELPSTVQGKTQEEKALDDRIFYALLKEELDWQITHLNNLLYSEEN